MKDAPRTPSAGLSSPGHLGVKATGWQPATTRTSRSRGRPDFDRLAGLPRGISAERIRRRISFADQDSGSSGLSDTRRSSGADAGVATYAGGPSLEHAYPPLLRRFARAARGRDSAPCSSARPGSRPAAPTVESDKRRCSPQSQARDRPPEQQRSELRWI